MDGTVDYRSYSNQGLLEAFQSIDRKRFPQNFTNIKIELDRRQLSEISQTPPSPAIVPDPIWPIEPAAGLADTATPISLWRYVALFAVIFYVGAVILGSVVEYFDLKRGSSLGNGLIFAAAIVVGNRFVNRNKRLFYPREANRLMLFCLLAILPLEVIALIGNPDILEKLSFRVALIALPFTVGLNALSVWIAYRFFARSTMLRRLNKLSTNAA